MEKKSQIDRINECISSMVYKKTKIAKAYNYYHCKRDKEQFRHLEENFGLGTATSITFTPLIKKHIDVLVGEYLELDPTLDITCKDTATISAILRDKQLAVAQAVNNKLKEFLKTSIYKTLAGQDEQQDDPVIFKEIEAVKKAAERSFVSDYEIAAQNILTYCKQSRLLDLKNKMRELFTDLLISGVCYYRVRKHPTKGLDIEILNPLDTFIARNPNAFFLNKSSAAVIRKYMTEEQILSEYGDELSDTAKANISDAYRTTSDSDCYIHASGATSFFDFTDDSCKTPGILGGLEVTPVWPDDENRYASNTAHPLIEVYECEWIEVDKKGVQHLHAGVKIGSDVYITRGEVQDAPRSVSQPKEVSLTINGMFFNDKNGQPFSLILSTIDLQD